MSHKLSLALVLAAFPTVAYAQSATVVVPDPPQPNTTVIVPESAPASSMTVVTSGDDTVVYDAWNAPVFATGAVTFGLAYGAAAITAAGNQDNQSDQRLVVPLVGPWLALSDRPSCDPAQAACDHETTAKVLLVADGIFQAAGLIGMIDGVLQPSSHVVRHRLAQDTSLHVTPAMVGSLDPTPGLGVFGRF